MRTSFIQSVITALLVPIAFGQTAVENRVFPFSKNRSALEINETATVIREMTDATGVSVDVAKKTLSLTGTAGQIAIGGWLFNELDGPAILPSATQQGRGPVVKGYRVSGDDVVHLLYLPDVKTVRDLSEVVTLVRSTGDIRRLMMSGQRATITRGTPDQTALTDWLFSELGQASRQSPAQSLTMHEYPLAVRADPAVERGARVRVYDLAHVATVYDFQEVVTMARFMADIRQLYSYSTARAVAARGTPEQLALVDWLFKDLDRAASPDASTQPGRDSTAHEYRLPESDEIVRVFYLSHNQTPQQIAEIATQIRAITQVRRLDTYTALRALALRGTPDQIALAEQFVRERDRY
jgi:hypothetical protein